MDGCFYLIQTLCKHYSTRGRKKKEPIHLLFSSLPRGLKLIHLSLGRVPVVAEPTNPGKTKWSECPEVKNRFLFDEEETLGRSINASYPLPSCPSDRIPFGTTEPPLIPRICTFRCSSGSRNRGRRTSRSNYESGNRKRLRTILSPPRELGP